MAERPYSYIVVFCLSMSAMFGAPSNADNAAMVKYKNYTPEQLASLPDKERNSSVPVGYTMAAQKGLARDGKLAIAMDLNTLMYPGVHDYAAAVKGFQADLGEKPTGQLTVSQILKLGVRASFQRVSAPGFPDTYQANFQPDYASVQGTLEIIDDRIAWPINHVKVFCSRTEKYCEKRMLILDIPREDGFAQMYHVQAFDTEFYNVTRWDAITGSVDAVPSTFEDTGCRSNSLSYNFKTKEFLEITRNTGRECVLAKVEKLTKPRIARIVDGRKVIQAKFAEIQKKAYSYLASDFRKAVDVVGTKAPIKPATR
jgi:hypothetical protein